MRPRRFHAFLLFLGHPVYAVREVSIHRFSKILSEFALEYRTTRERVLQQKQKRANHRERNKTRGKMITDVSLLPSHRSLCSVSTSLTAVYFKLPLDCRLLHTPVMKSAGHLCISRTFRLLQQESATSY